MDKQLKRVISSMRGKPSLMTLLVAVVGLVAAAVVALQDGLGSQRALAPLANLSPGDVLVEFTPGSAESLIIALLNSADKDIKIAAYSFTSKPIAEALVAARDRGVNIQVVMDKSNKTSQYSSATFLKNQRIPVRINERYAIQHNKFIVVDGEHTKTGSFNYSKAAATRNAENVMVLYGVPAIAQVYLKEWQRLWDESSDY